MKNSTTRSPGFRFTAGKAGAAVVLLSMIGGMALCPALADRDHGHGERDHHGYRGDHGHWRHGYDRRDWRGRPEYEPVPVYAPAPVYYAPQQSSGVSLFFPIHIR
ncbi:MAG: hypothetical protein ACHQIO_06620 [Nevskiales bacterium]